jgi:guanosine-3',5'-bis(diphosphate) 3'-pyrophosphohydrolase
VKNAPGDDHRVLLEACAFAARAHRHQERKDGTTPYYSHVFRVCLIVRHVFGIDDRHTLAAALLHDTIEDTTTDLDDIEAAFGAETGQYVAALTKDKRLPEAERETAYEDCLKEAPWQVKACKLADVYDNLMDCTHTDPHQQSRTFKHAHGYLNALAHRLPDRLRGAWQQVSELLAALETPQTGRAGGA